MVDYEETRENAILSLEQQIKQLVKDAFDKGYQCGYKDRKDEPKRGEWTYCSERMPAETGAYLCLTEIPTVIAYRHIKIGAYHDINGWMLDDVIAWMPLPKLWEGADDEREFNKAERCDSNHREEKSKNCQQL